MATKLDKVLLPTKLKSTAYHFKFCVHLIKRFEQFSVRLIEHLFNQYRVGKRLILKALDVDER